MLKDVIIYETLLLHRDYGKLLQTNPRIASIGTGREDDKLNEKDTLDFLAKRSAEFSIIYSFYRMTYIVLVSGVDAMRSVYGFWLYGLVWIGFAIFAFLRKKNAGLIVLAVVFVVFGDTMPHLSLFYLFNGLAVLLLMIISMLNCIPLCRSELKTNKIMGFIPALFITLKCVIILWDYLPYGSLRVIPFLLLYLLEIPAFLFLGLWMNYRGKSTASEQIAGQRNEFGTSDSHGNPKSDFYSPTDDRADRLKIYETLLEGGAISPEEFEKKKKEIMGP